VAQIFKGLARKAILAQYMQLSCVRHVYSSHASIAR